MDIKKIEELIGVLEGSRTEELTVRRGDVSVHIRKGAKPKPSPKPRAGVAKAQASGVSAEPAGTERAILSPMVGIFHAGSDATTVGSTITQGQTVGAIESMKLLNDVVAEFGGTVTEVMVEDGSPVEYGQLLCKVEPV